MERRNKRVPSKLKNIVDLYNETLSDICRSPENWASFLITASNNYKYNFADQVLIFLLNCTTHKIV